MRYLILILLFPLFSYPQQKPKPQKKVVSKVTQRMLDSLAAMEAAMMPVDGFIESDPVIDADTISPQGKYERAWWYETKGYVDEAVSLYESLVTDSPTCSMCYLNIGDIYENRLQLPNSAIVWYRRGLARESEIDMQSFFVQQIAFSVSGGGDEAIGYISGFIKNNPNNIEYYRMRVRYVMRSDKYKEAIPDLQKIINSYEATYSDYWHMAECKKKTSDLAEAIGYYTTAIEMCEKEFNKQDVVARQFWYLDRLYAERAQGKLDLADYYGAKKDYQKALSITKFASHRRFYNQIAFCEYMMAQYSQSILTLNKSISPQASKLVSGENNEVSYSYFLRGLVKLELKNTDGACQDWSTAGELGEKRAYDFISRNCNR